jgi:hypothetical protein
LLPAREEYRRRGSSRELFAGFRQLAGRAEHGATAFAA